MAAEAAAKAEAAARAASDAGRTLQARSQETRQERAPEPKKEEKQQRLDPPHDRGEKAEKADEPRKPRKFSDLHNEMTEDILKRQAKTEGWKEVKFEQGPDGQKRAVVKDSAPEPEAPDAEDLEEVPATQTAEDTPSPVEAAPAAEPAAAEATPQVKTVRVKVDGEEFDAPEEDVNAAGGVRAYQMQKASENRLRQAADAVAEIKRLAAGMVPQKPSEPQPSDAEFIESKVDAIRFGTQSEAAAAVQEILARANKQNDPQAMIEQAVGRIKHDQAVADFDKEFADLAAKPLALKLVVAMRNDQLAQHSRERKPVDWKNLYFTIGQQVRSLVGGSSQPASAPQTQGPTSQKSAKEARKASIVVLPTAAARAAPPAEPKPQTREEILDEMKKSRVL